MYGRTCLPACLRGAQNRDIHHLDGKGNFGRFPRIGRGSGSNRIYPPSHPPPTHSNKFTSSKSHQPITVLPPSAASKEKVPANRIVYFCTGAWIPQLLFSLKTYDNPAFVFLKQTRPAHLPLSGMQGRRGEKGWLRSQRDRIQRLPVKSIKLIPRPQIHPIY